MTGVGTHYSSHPPCCNRTCLLAPLLAQTVELIDGDDDWLQMRKCFSFEGADAAYAPGTLKNRLELALKASAYSYYYHLHLQ